MSINADIARCTLPGVVFHPFQLVGVGAGAPTIVYGIGVTVSRTSQGLYKFTWRDNPGKFLTLYPGLGADTPSGHVGVTVVRDTFDTTNGVYSIEVRLTDTADAVVDLAAARYLDLLFLFQGLATV